MFLSVSFRLLLECMCLLRHQVDRARATHIDSLLIPRAYAMSHPMMFLAAARREFGPLVMAAAFLSYFPTSHKLLYFSSPDLILRIGITAVDNILHHQDRLRLALSWYVMLGMSFNTYPCSPCRPPHISYHCHHTPDAHC